MNHPNQKPNLVQGKFFTHVLALLLIYIFICGVSRGQTSQDELDFKLKSLVSEGSILIAGEKNILYRYPKDENPLLIPASILKLATALAAFHYLGTDFSYKTNFYFSEKGSLGIKGFGDPFLVSEELRKISQKISQIPGLPKHFNGLFIDNSVFSTKIKIPGIEFSKNPYDASNGAVVFNFNTVFLKVDEKGIVSSAEKQTPLIPMAKNFSKNLSPGKHRISIPPKNSIKYAGELFQEFLAQEGFSFDSKNVTLRPLSSIDNLIYTHMNSSVLTKLISGMMHYSNNFIANQLLITIGLELYGEPATLEKGRRALKEYLINELKIPEEEFILFEGSGISRNNRMTPETVWKILKAFSIYKNLLKSDFDTLSKTGTLKGVSTLAGYLPSRTPRYFVIMLNQAKNLRDEILKLILSSEFSKY